MTRVQKLFWKKLGIVLSPAISTAFVLVSSYWVGVAIGIDPNLTMFVGVIGFIIFPIAALIVRDIYRDAKREVEWENRKLLRDIKNDNYS